MRLARTPILAKSHSYLLSLTENPSWQAGNVPLTPATLTENSPIASVYSNLRASQVYGIAERKVMRTTVHMVAALNGTDFCNRYLVQADGAGHVIGLLCRQLLNRLAFRLWCQLQRCPKRCICVLKKWLVKQGCAAAAASLTAAWFWLCVLASPRLWHPPLSQRTALRLPACAGRETC